MATYEEIYGKRVKDFDSDPTLDSSYEGQVWYNSATGTLKSVVAVQAWISSSPLVGAARSNVGSSGTQTASLSLGGSVSSPGYTNAVEEYNGSGWSTSTNYPLSTDGTGVAGTQTSAVAFGGNTHPPSVDRTETFEYDGSSWTSGGALPAGRRGLNNSGFGSQTAAVQSGGLTPGGTHNTSNEYNGSSWTAGNTINTTRYVHAGSGTLTAGIISSGVGAAPSYPSLTNVEEYDGTTFTSVNSMSTGHGSTAGSNQAPQTSLIVFGGNTTPGPVLNSTESYDGTNWTTQPNLATARSQLGGSGSSSSSGLAFAGYTTAVQSITEEYNSSINTFTAAAWASGGNMSQKRYGGASGGTPNAAWYATGYINPGYSNATEEYNGSSWTAGGNITGTNTQSTGSCGTLTAGSRFSGTPPVGPPGTPKVQHEQYDGTSWTNNPATLQQATSGTSGSGTQDACLYTRGRPSTYNEEYNGTAWSAANTISTTGRSGTNSGTQTAGLFLGGEQPPGPYLKLVDEYDGTNWTAGGSLVIPQGGSCNSGTQTDTMAASGYTTDSPWGPSTIEECQIYDGTAFATTASVSADKSSGGSSNRGNGPSGSNGALIFAGSPGPNSTATEEFTAVTETVTAKTLTTS